ncbi:MAG: cell division protein FtsA [Candidatus Nomurabacteria bacterium]|jgi:cell division protein FtsA|nr:cell division protein FtsA [Candidatus Nomurabacteria bacterium]
MEEKSRFAVGLDVGTSNIRAVIGSVDRDGNVSVVGYSEVPSGGMRKGVVVNLAGPANAIDVCLKPVEDMSGIQVNAATIGINGSHILSAKTEGMIAVGTTDHEIDEADLDRVDQVAATGKFPANREILDLVPYSYSLDGQTGIRDPLGMTGSRLEIKASIISALLPYCDNLRKAAEMAKVQTERLVSTVVASARAVLTSQQMENGVGVVDLGATTTGVAVYDEGDLQYVGVIPIGGNDITKDLATILKTIPEVAEEIKIRFATGRFGENEKDIVIKQGREELTFPRAKVDEVVEARLEEIFEGVRKELKRANYDKRLPEGIVLTGGAAKLRDIEIYARSQVELAVRVSAPTGLGGVSESVAKPEYATAVGLMLTSAQFNPAPGQNAKKSSKKSSKSKGGPLSRFFGFFK